MDLGFQTLMVLYMEIEKAAEAVVLEALNQKDS
jgi:hypothetical protein